MNSRDERFERLILRSLHEKLTDEETLELDRALLKHPHLRDLREDYREIDRLSGAALDGMVFQKTDDVNGTRSVSDAAIGASGSFHRVRLERESRGLGLAGRRWGWWLEHRILPGAVAAALVGMLIFQRPGTEAPKRASPPSRPSSVTAPLQPVMEGGTYHSAHPASTHIKRHTRRDVIGVMDHQGRIWILEMDHTKTMDASESESSSNKGVHEL